MSKPKSWDECSVLAQDQSRLEALIRIRLIDLAFNQDSAVAIRAIELLKESATGQIEDDLSHLSLEEVRGVRERARKFIAASRLNGGENAHD